jgi:hypothetical protein
MTGVVTNALLAVIAAAVLVLAGLAISRQIGDDRAQERGEVACAKARTDAEIARYCR